MSSRNNEPRNRFIVSARAIRMFRLNASIELRRIRREEVSDLLKERDDLLDQAIHEHDEDLVAERLLGAVA